MEKDGHGIIILEFTVTKNCCLYSREPKKNIIVEFKEELRRN